MLVSVSRFVDIASNNLKIQYVVFAKQRRISGCVLSVGLLAAEGMDCASCNQFGDLFPCRVNISLCYILIVGTREGTPGGTGRRQSIAIHLNLKHSVFGIMLVTIMFTALFNPKLMAS